MKKSIGATSISLINLYRGNVAIYDNYQQTYEKGIERCAIRLEFLRYCIGDKGLQAVATGLLDERSEKKCKESGTCSVSFFKKY